MEYFTIKDGSRISFIDSGNINNFQTSVFSWFWVLILWLTQTNFFSKKGISKVVDMPWLKMH
ncbi:MAG: hypothetical protein BA862_01170 [Desulfobulbaceae bacterium S3730MH12]|nr:MAG: hypothetical protein BA866_04730 [Desulfobulbaceae bacterium S5133MH15]OEU55106.1 MAG: hypothetical protein BA862_01170 [Desulfobulbaceae bacterium S3730MH12]